MSEWQTLADIRREYGVLSLSEDSVLKSPVAQFKSWFEECLKSEKSDPTAMVLSTVDEQGHPDSRVVLLKGIEEEAFVFFTNYQSAKAIQLQNSPYAALNFYWPQMARQIRIRGRVTRIPEKQSDLYFSTRPVKSQYSAIISPQSKQISDRHSLEKQLNDLIESHGQAPVQRPEQWGGYKVMPEVYEFWQGRDNRLHDRIQYTLSADQWLIRRLAP